MKKLLHSFLLLLICAPLSAHDYQAIAPIQRVRIYTSGVFVERSLQLQVAQGEHIIVVPGISGAIQPQSLTVGGKGGFVLSSVDVLDHFSNAQVLTPEQSAIQRQIDSTQTLLRQKGVTQAQLEKEQAFYDANKQPGGTQKMSIQELQAYAAFYSEQTGRLQMARLENEEAIKKLQTLKETLEKQLSVVKNESSRLKMVQLRLAAPRAGNIQIDLSYYIYGLSGWTPIYELQAKEGSKEVTAKLSAKIWQQTGEAWDQVKLVLSTGNPSVGIGIPNMYPWLVNFEEFRPVLARAAQNKMIRAEYLEESVMMDMVASESAMMAQADMGSNSQSLVFEIPGTVQFTGGKRQERTLPLKEYSLQAAFSYLALPKYAEELFLKAKLPMAGGWAPFAGEMQVFYDGAYVGNSYYQPNMATDSLDFSFGRSPQVAMKREAQSPFEQVSGRETRLTRGWDLSFRNQSNRPVSFTLREQIPVSGHADIRVELLQAEGAQYNSETGMLEWEINLAGGEVRTVSYSFMVRHPKDRQLNL
jgi:conserved hypothetical protein